MEQTASIAVIGAGAAGIECVASLCRDNHHRIVLFEANDRLFGRCHRIALDDVLVDAGAAWVHGWNASSNRGARRSEDFGFDGIAASKLRGTVVFGKNGKRLSEAAQKKGKKRWSRRELKEDDLSDDERVAFHFERMAFENYEGGHVEDMSTNPDLETAELVGPHLCIRNGGYPALLQRIVDSFKSTAEIRSSTRVEKIEEAAEGVLVDGELFDKCIICLPLGVLKEQQASLFSPPLNAEKKEALSQLGAGCCEKLILRFDNIFWNVSTFGTDRLYVSSVENACGGAPILVVWTYADVDPLDPEATASEILSLWKAVKRSKLVSWHRTEWGKSQFSRGSYSYNRRDATPQTRRILQQPCWNKRLFFAGEYTSVLQYGMVHGALEEGHRAALEALDSL